eukprot:TRINITY_DN74200_c0_g1_i1.p1 TRINITY_DN74200_c0_g1~~TRINITY_DN74200_c0_g1_i1.p1  ORF type:complete len:165 (-),score=60.73 TRINITY_DN74200_c0_g1_i1:77-538(-)
MSDENCVSVLVNTLRKPGYCMIRGQPCRITEITQKCKATNKGNDRIHLVGVHMETGKKYEDTLLATLQIDQILVKREVYDVLDVDTHEGTVSVLTKSGDTKDDLNLDKSDNPNEKYNAVCKDLVDRFEDGEELKVTVQVAMGQETIVEVTAAE